MKCCCCCCCLSSDCYHWVWRRDGQTLLQHYEDSPWYLWMAHAAWPSLHPYQIKRVLCPLSMTQTNMHPFPDSGGVLWRWMLRLFLNKLQSRCNECSVQLFPWFNSVASRHFISLTFDCNSLMQRQQHQERTASKDVVGYVFSSAAKLSGWPQVCTLNIDLLLYL